MSYTRTQVALHWLTVLLVAMQFLLSDGIEDAYEAAPGQFTPGAALHVLPGVLILLLTLWRLALRLRHGAPPPPETEPAWAQLAAKAAHLGFYGLLVLLPLSGMAGWTLGIEAAAEAHEALTSLMLLLIAAHVGAVLVHQLVWRTGLMARMSLRG